jgi:hypothetical protein
MSKIHTYACIYPQVMQWMTKLQGIMVQLSRLCNTCNNRAESKRKAASYPFHQQGGYNHAQHTNYSDCRISSAKTNYKLQLLQISRQPFRSTLVPIALLALIGAQNSTLHDNTPSHFECCLPLSTLARHTSSLYYIDKPTSHPTKPQKP